MQPASAASWRARALSLGHIAPDADVVAVLTGHTLKDTDAIVAYHERYGKDADRAARV